MRRILLGALAVVVIAGAGAAAVLQPWRADGPSGRLTLYGNVAVREVEVAFMVEGRIQEMLVEEGDRVSAGQTLARVDPGYYRDLRRLAEARVAEARARLARLRAGSRPEKIEQAEADLAAAKAQVRRARRVFQRRKRLHAAGDASQEVLDEARAGMESRVADRRSARQALKLARKGPRAETITAARAQLESRRASLALARRRLRDTTLEAPGAGTVLTRVREPGAVVSPGTPVYTIARDRPVWVRAWVGEPRLGDVVPGTPVKVITDSRPDRPYEGHVGYVSPRAEFTPKRVETPDLRTSLVYRVRIVVENPDSNLRQGMPVTLRLDPSKAPEER